VNECIVAVEEGMPDRLTVAAQLSTSHSAAGAVGRKQVLRKLEQALEVAPVDILIVGSEENPDVYQALTDRETRPVERVFLWYNLLSDYPGMTSEHLLCNYEGLPSRGWGDFAETGEISETFRFACPNRPAVREITFHHLERLLTSYDFDGVFLDKFRFPSPANGLSEMFSCFCEHCYRAAAEWGLDLDEVKKTIERLPKSVDADDCCDKVASEARWWEALLADRPPLLDFLDFRADSITRLVTLTHGLTQRLGKRLAFDVFSPALAPLVGQDYAAIAPYGVWAKPMIYRLVKGPAGLRLELPALASELRRFLGLGRDEIDSWARRSARGLADTTFQSIDAEGAPLHFIAGETRRAVASMAPTPVYLGVETVSMPGVVDVTPEDVRAAVGVAREAEAAGVVLSWDLMHTPIDNLRAVEAVV